MHLSYYELTLEPNTLFHAQPPTLPEDEAIGRMQTACSAALESGGYRRYEVSAYARRDQRCRHNLNYWQFGDYLGIGAGAHGKVTLPALGTIERNRKQKHPQTYLDHSEQKTRQWETGRTMLSNRDAALEFMMNALRLTEGVSSDLFRQRTGLDLDEIRPTLDQAREQGLMDADPARLVATKRGYAHLDTLLTRFMATKQE